ncbi:MAG: hypothetical protein D6738_05680 [Acidobacteria bacterium]|nr:MAG: hypothetical protein D6738_05680 [Acidobacteriota bacterium]
MEARPVPAVDDGRIVARLGAPGAGPLMLVTVAVHGNEPAGPRAAQRVVSRLREARIALRGELCVVTGNVAASRRGVRYVDRDMNRMFLAGRIAALRSGAEPVACSEDRELLALLDVVDPLIDAARRAGRPAYLVDLHTSSADGPPFVTTGDTLRNRRFAFGVPLPLILGLEEQIDGTATEYFGERGLVTLAVEAGRHDDPASVDHHESVLWHALVRAGLVAGRALPWLAWHRARLEAATAGLPSVSEVRHRHRIRPDDRFEMVPGFRNFQRVRRGEVLARDARGEIRSPERGLVLLPLYQGLGDDGFFFGRRVGRVERMWAVVLRRLRMLWLLRLLPGVERVPDPERLVVRVARRRAPFVPLALLLAFGFRKVREDGDALVFSRRAWDSRSPFERPARRPPRRTGAVDV